MKRILFSMGLAALCAMPAFGEVVLTCEDAQQAIADQQEEAWISRCADAQSRNVTAAVAEQVCRRWLETCRRSSSLRPSHRTF